MIHWKTDMYLSMVILFFNVFFFFQCSKLPDEAVYFPQLFNGLLALLAIILLFSALKRKGREAEKQQYNFKNAVLIVIGLVCYAFLFKFLGYIISTGILVIYIIYMLGYRQIWKMLITACCGVGFSYIVFKLLLKVPLPTLFI